MSKFVFIIIALTLILNLTACEMVWPPTTYKQCHCEQLPNILPFHVQVGKPFSKNELEDWINLMYGVSEDKITEYSDDLRWHVGGIEYTATIQNSLFAQAASYDRNSAVPSAQCVVAWLGKPDQYKTHYGVKAPIPEPVLELEMIFEDLGIWVSGEQYFDSSTKTPSFVATEFPITNFRVVRSGTTEELLRQLGWGREVSAQEVQRYKLWPEKWEDLNINTAQTSGE